MTSPLDDIFHAFEARTNFEKDLSGQKIKREYRLDRMRALCEIFGNPQNEYDVIHIAGSKGKGSTAAYIAALMKEAGHRVGIYSSPHLADYRERFRVEGEPFPEEKALQTARSVMLRCADEGEATTFELLTLFGFVFFRDLGCDTVVLECGLGGRLDATNVITRPKGVVLTPIEMEHADILGPELTDIAREKAGILKAGSPAWTAQQSPAVLGVFRERARELGIPLHELGGQLAAIQEMRPEGFRWCLNWKNRTPETVLLGMGAHVQAYNAALALEVVRSLEPALPGHASRVLTGVSLPGRFQVLRQHPPVVLDGAHTPESVRSVMKAFFTLGKGDSGGDPLLLFGCAKGKDYDGMARILCGGEYPSFKNVIVSTPGTFKLSDPPAVARSFKKTGARVELIPSPSKAWERALEYAGDRRGILVTGSFYMAGEIVKIIV